jgi:hypothetical protein
MGTGSGGNWSTTSAMGLRLPIPGVCGAFGVEPAGQSAGELVNNDLGLIDQHTHAPGFGTLVPTAGLNINADLPFGGFNALGLRSSRYNAQSLGGLTGADIGCVLVSGVDLYYVDLNGNQIQLTASGAPAGTPGSISGLISPAAATYTPSSKTFSWTSSSGFSAYFKMGPIALTDPSVSGGKAATIEVPTGLASNYNFILPSGAPASLSLLTMSSAGQLATFAGMTVSGSNITFPGTLTATAASLTATGSAAGVTAQGGPTGNGITATGGGTSGYGGAFTGGAGTPGIIATGGSGAAGGTFLGTAGYGVFSQGGAAFDGGHFIGGSLANGLSVVGGSGLLGLNGGAAIVATGGPNGSPGGIFTGTSGYQGIVATGQGSAAGVAGHGGASGYGGAFDNGAGTGGALYAASINGSTAQALTLVGSTAVNATGAINLSDQGANVRAGSQVGDLFMSQGHLYFCKVAGVPTMIT